MHLNDNWVEKNPISWVYKFLLGPAMIVDGIVYWSSIGFVSLNSSLFVARQLAKSRNIDEVVK